MSEDHFENAIENLQDTLDIFKRKRREGNNIEAQSAMELAKNIIEGLPKNQHQHIWGLYLYERAYYLLSEGDYSAASDTFFESMESAQSGGDVFNAILADFMGAYTKYAGELAPAEPTLSAIRAIYNRLQKATNRGYEPDSAGDSVTYNILNALADFTFECKSPDFLHFAEQLRTFPTHYAAMRKGGNLYRFLDARMRARMRMAAGDFWGATRIFCSYLYVEDESFYSAIDCQPDKDLCGMVATRHEEISREYRDFGVSIQQLNIPNAGKYAAIVWHKGLTLPEGFCNKVFQKDIRNLLKLADLSS